MTTPGGAQEIGLANIYVRLLDAEGTLSTSTRTDETGNYQLQEVYPGDYRVEFVLPQGTTFSAPDQADGDVTVSHVDPGASLEESIPTASNPAFCHQCLRKQMPKAPFFTASQKPAGIAGCRKVSSL